MNRKDRAKDEWINETMMFQRIAGTGEDSYEELAEYYDSSFKRLSSNDAETLAENAKVLSTILKAAVKLLYLEIIEGQHGQSKETSDQRRLPRKRIY